MSESAGFGPIETSWRPPRVLDLFSGSGGISHGFSRAGFEVVAGVDIWHDALLTFAANHPGAQTLEADLGDPDVIPRLLAFNPVEVIVGGPPCQGFSISGLRDPEDPRNKLYEGFVRAVQALEPDFFMMENVPNLKSMGGGAIIEAISTDFENLGYKVSNQVLLAADFGVPQNRKRLFLVGQRVSNSAARGFEFPLPTHADAPITCQAAIGDLPDRSVCDGERYPSPADSEYQQLMRHESIGLWNHQVTAHNERTREIIGLVPDGGNYKDLPSHLQDTRKVHIAWTRFSSSRPSYTIDTGHRHHFHYQYDRVPTVRESARLQSFPDDFHFLGTKTSQYRQVGNAVPPLLAEALAWEIASSLRDRIER